ncbi:hypothetical protein [Halorhodospira halophila]|nr:hypothetical protein [Halorhodospira halophila]
MSEEDQERLFVAAFEYSGNVYYEDEDLSQELRLKYAVWSNANGGPYAVYQSTGSLVSRTDRTVIYYGTAALLNSEAGFYNGSPTAEEIKDLVRTALNGENYETSTGEVPLGPEEVALFLENITADPFFLHEA